METSKEKEQTISCYCRKLQGR